MQNGTFLHPHPAYELPVTTNDSPLPMKRFISQVIILIILFNNRRCCIYKTAVFHAGPDLTKTKA